MEVVLMKWFLWVKLNDNGYNGLPTYQHKVGLHPWIDGINLPTNFVGICLEIIYKPKQQVDQ